ncbi:iron-sulfur cluster repair di-iron protein [Daejeonella oryzae]|uniref:iron-sulfur cluster repair di-iron protein n=1 Tax=Daejeonella oryzae TaxID=1122943 RepID=UPI000478B20A|nr:iron-sulfur cluster repair di-iron protein [Daejeonella oryzae]
MISINDETIGSMVARNYKAASVFQKFGIDFCCKGGRTLEEACKEKQVDAETVKNEVDAVLSKKDNESIDFKSWPLDLLADYIEKKHHRYVTEKAPELTAYLHKINKVHGEKHPELNEIYNLFVASVQELSSHMKKEENILFPFIRKMVETKSKGRVLNPPQFGTVKNPIEVMMQEHVNEGERFERISKLTNSYTAPEDGCTTYKVAFALLKEFEADLHAHIHLENNILFPKAIILEKNFNACSIPVASSL